MVPKYDRPAETFTDLLKRYMDRWTEQLTSCPEFTPFEKPLRRLHNEGILVYRFEPSGSCYEECVKYDLRPSMSFIMDGDKAEAMSEELQRLQKNLKILMYSHKINQNPPKTQIQRRRRRAHVNGKVIKEAYECEVVFWEFHERGSSCDIKDAHALFKSPTMMERTMFTVFAESFGILCNLPELIWDCFSKVCGSDGWDWKTAELQKDKSLASSSENSANVSRSGSPYEQQTGVNQGTATRPSSQADAQPNKDDSACGFEQASASTQLPSQSGVSSSSLPDAQTDVGDAVMIPTQESPSMQPLSQPYLNSNSPAGAEHETKATADDSMKEQHENILLGYGISRKRTAHECDDRDRQGDSASGNPSSKRRRVAA